MSIEGATYTQADIAVRLQMSPRAVIRRLFLTGKIPYIKLSRVSYRALVKDYEAFVTGKQKQAIQRRLT